MTTLPTESSVTANKKSRKTILWLLIAFALCTGVVFALWVLFAGLPWLTMRLAKNNEGRAPLHGVVLVLQAEIDEGEPSKEDLQRAIQVLDGRARGLGVHERKFTISGQGEITAQLPTEAGAGDQLEALLMVGQIEFVDAGYDNLSTGKIIATDLASNAFPPVNIMEPEPSKVYHTLLTGDQVSTASLTTLSSGNYGVLVAFNSEGQHILAEHTRNHPGETLAILLDKRILSAPRIQSEISDGMAVIEGAFSYDTANQLVLLLTHKALPFRIKVVRQNEY